MKAIIAICLSLAALPAAAAEEPDAIYGRYHRAIVAGDAAEMLRHASAAQRAELAEMSAAQREAALKMIGSLMPRAFMLHDKTVLPGGTSARLLLSGPGGSVLDARSETLYGNVRMVLERGEWKVASTNWSNTRPPGLQAAAKAPAAPQKAAAPPPAAMPKAPAQKAVAPARGAPVVGSINATPERKLGMAKEPCVYKPVMTAEDIENCK